MLHLNLISCRCPNSNGDLLKTIIEKCNTIKKVGVIVVIPEISPQPPVGYQGQNVSLIIQFGHIAFFR